MKWWKSACQIPLIAGHTPTDCLRYQQKRKSVRFGETLKAYLARGQAGLSSLTFIPLALAGYQRYLTGINDAGEPFTLSTANLPALTPLLEGFALGKPL